jgi:hypothetical protein
VAWHAADAAGRTSSNLKGSTKQFGWLQAPTTPEQGYPGQFHVGFLQPTRHAVDLMHESLSARNYMAPKPTKLERGGPETCGFYYEAPGGVLVEVSTMNIAEPA